MCPRTLLLSNHRSLRLARPVKLPSSIWVILFKVNVSSSRESKPLGNRERWKDKININFKTTAWTLRHLSVLQSRVIATWPWIPQCMRQFDYSFQYFVQFSALTHRVTLPSYKRIKHQLVSNTYQAIINRYFNDIIENPRESPNKESESCQVLFGFYSQYLLMACYNYNSTYTVY